MILSYLTILHRADPDVSVTNDFKHKEIKGFEDYMKTALNIMPAIDSGC